MKNILIIICCFAIPCFATVYKVTPNNNSYVSALNKLKPNDVIIFEPGEYYGGKLITHGDVTLKARIPGSVVIRGDVPAKEFTQTNKNVWETKCDKMPEGVNERDTLTIYKRTFSITELGRKPACWFWQNGKLYIHTSDSDNPKMHNITISNYSGDGLVFQTAVNSKKPINNVVIDGLIITGFGCNGRKKEVWFSRNNVFQSMLIVGAKNCTIKNTTSFLNATGMVMKGMDAYGGASENSKFIKCRAYGNDSINTIFNGGIGFNGDANNCLIEECFTVDNYPRGIFHYAGVGKGNIIDKCIVLDALRTKTNAVRVDINRTVTKILDNYWNLENQTVCFNTYTQYDLKKDREKNNILQAKNIHPYHKKRDFVDWQNYDYRPTSPNKYKNRTPFPYDENVVIITTSDALKENTYKGVANKELFLDGDSWDQDLTIGNAKDLKIVARGTKTLTFNGKITIINSENVKIERLAFKNLSLTDSKDIVIKQCVGNLEAKSVENLRLKHNMFDKVTLDKCSELFSTANIFAEKTESDTTGWSDYNAYAQSVPANEKHSFIAIPEKGENYSIKNAHLFNGKSIDGLPVGIYKRQNCNSKFKIDNLKITALTPNSANIEFFSNMPTSGTLFYSINEENHEINFSTDNYHSIGLKDLKPNSKISYYINVRTIPKMHFSNQELTNKTYAVQTEPQKTVVPTEWEAPCTYIVSKDGSDKNDGIKKPWETISYAISQAKAGDTILIQPGRYNEYINITRTGAKDKPITIKGVGTVWLDGDMAAITTGIEIKEQHYIKLENLHLQNYEKFGTKIINSSNITILKSLFNGFGGSFTWAITAEFSSNLLLNNIVRTFGHEGIFIDRCPNFTISNSVMFFGGVDSLRVVNYNGEKTTIINNIFTDNMPLKAINPIFYVYNIDALTEQNNCLYTRLPSDKKIAIGYSEVNGKTLPVPKDGNVFLGNKQVPYNIYLKDYKKDTNTIFVNPQLPIFPKFIYTYKDMEDWRKNFKGGNLAETELIRAFGEMTFKDFFARNKTCIKNNIGLEIEKFNKEGILK